MKWLGPAWLLLLASCSEAMEPLPEDPGPLWAWEDLASVPYDVRGPAAVEIDGRIYVIGAVTPVTAFEARVQIFDTSTLTWSMGPPIPDWTHWGAATVVDGRIHYFGGQAPAGRRDPVDHHWILDPATSTWSEGPPLPEPMAGMAVETIGSRIFMFGGYDGGGELSAATWVLDTETKEWRESARVPGARAHWDGALIGDTVYLVGGSIPGTSSPDILMFDLDSERWTLQSRALPIGRDTHGVVAVGENLCVIGASGAGELCFAPASRTWIDLPDIQRVRRELAAVTAGDHVYAIGGAFIGGGQLPSTLTRLRVGPEVMPPEG